MFTIYGICDPTNNLIKYVGKTSLALNRRLSNHIYKAKSGRSKSNLSNWINGIISSGMKPYIVEIESVDKHNNDDWKIYEKKWISKLEGDGYDLLNQTNGGNGSHIYKHIPDDILNMIGKIPDSRVAKMAGVSRKCISYYRERDKISPAPKCTYRYNPHMIGKISPKRIKFSEEILELIGSVPDTEVAKIAGVHYKTIFRFRQRNNIPPCVRFGEMHPMAKLSKEDVDKILSICKKKTIKEIAKEFDVSYYTIWDILNERSWCVKND